LSHNEWAMFSPHRQKPNKFPGGMFAGLQPLLSRLPTPNPNIDDKFYTLSAFQTFEWEIQRSQPSLRYNELLTLAYKTFAASLSLPEPSEQEARDFGSGIGSWPAFPDTVAALQALKKHYKLVILSNIDNDSIARTIAGPLNGVEFDAVFTAQNIGSYKPDLNNFRFLVEGVKRILGVEKGEILHTAQSLTHDLVPAKSLGLSGTCRYWGRNPFSTLNSFLNFSRDSVLILSELSLSSNC
jgi:2-haloalkanoic acid dehalogenase type II